MGILNSVRLSFLNPLPALLSLLTGLPLTGCYESFTPDLKAESVLCLNSLITAGEPIEVEVTHTWLYTDESASINHQVNDATLTIIVNDREVAEGYLPEEGDRIKILAVSPTFGRAEAEVEVPFSVPIRGLEWKAEVTDRWVRPEYDAYDFHIKLRAGLTLADPANVQNYYLFSYTSFPSQNESGGLGVKFSPGTFYYQAEPIFAEHIGILDAINGSDADGFTFFTDRGFSGDTYTLNIRFNNMEFDMRNTRFSDDLLDCGLILRLSTISPSYYNWTAYNWFSSNGLIVDFEEIGAIDPLWGYSNVSTHAGVVAAQSVATYILSLRDFLRDEIANTNVGE